MPAKSRHNQSYCFIWTLVGVLPVTQGKWLLQGNMVNQSSDPSYFLKALTFRHWRLMETSLSAFVMLPWFRCTSVDCFALQNACGHSGLSIGFLLSCGTLAWSLLFYCIIGKQSPRAWILFLVHYQTFRERLGNSNAKLFHARLCKSKICYHVTRLVSNVKWYYANSHEIDIHATCFVSALQGCSEYAILFHGTVLHLVDVSLGTVTVTY